MINGIQLESGNYGLRAVATSAWSEEMTDYILDEKILDLELNDGKGWRGKDVSFLRSFPRLKSLTIIDLTIPSVEPIHSLQEIEVLKVITYCETEIKFSAFPRLRNCSLEWRRKATSLFDCLTLKKLFVNRYKGSDLAPFSSLVNLEDLAIVNASVHDVLGLRTLSRLRSLRLANLRQLTSLAGLEYLASLEQLEIHTCRRIRSIDEVGSLMHLRRLSLNNDGDIQSLKVLDKLKNLESVAFYESTNILDGDLSPLMRQGNLSNVTFQNRRHYSHKREEFTGYSRKTISG